MTSCVPGFDQLTRWSGPACALWAGRTPDEKRQWVQNYFAAHGLVANSASVGALIAQMDASCPARPAGSLYDGLNDNEAWNDAQSDSGNSSDSSRPSDAVQVLTNQNFTRGIASVFHDISNTVVGAFNSSNRTNYGYPNNVLNSLGGYPSAPGQTGGVSGAFTSPYGYGAGAISWTPIIIGGVIVVSLGVFLMSMSNRRS